MSRASLLVALGLSVGASACRQPEPPKPALTDAPTHVRYTEALSEFGLDKTALGQDWLAAASRALTDPIPTTLPFQESGYLSPADPTAVGYALDLRRGRRLVIDVTFETSEPARLYVDLFEHRDDESPRLVSGTEPGQMSFSYEARRDGRHILRLQPELLRGGRYTIVERTTASLGFPVEGMSLRASLSGFGAPRDGGRRDHHGIDIFAPRGTPVVAAVDGTVRVSTSNLGGQVIWLSTGARRQRLYYAHLHDWAVEDGTRVQAGQVIGYVGNTGNARTTPPHLHFGVYDRGPVDPYPFLQSDDPQPGAVTAPIDLLDRWARVNRARASVYARPSTRSTSATMLESDAVVRVIAAASGFFRIELADGGMGFVLARDLVAAEAPLGEVVLEERTSIFESARSSAPVVDVLGAGDRVDFLGRSGERRLVRLDDGRIGWLGPAAADSRGSRDQP